MKTPLSPLSVVILARNEEAKIADCIKSVSWAKEIWVIDDESIDKTPQIAVRLGAHVVRRKMDIEGRQRNFACSQASQPWILSLDADERIPAELAAEISAIVTANNSSHNAYSMPLKNYFGRQWLRYGGWHPAAKVRLFRKGTLSYAEEEVHPGVTVNGSIGSLQNFLIHLNFDNFDHYITKFNRLTTLEAVKATRLKKPLTAWKASRRMLHRFFKSYVLQKGYKEGRLGFILALFSGLYHIVTYAKSLKEVTQ